jgi:hypothetical protein
LTASFCHELQSESPVFAAIPASRLNARTQEQTSLPDTPENRLTFACPALSEMCPSTLQPAIELASTSRQCTSPVKKPSGNIVFFRYSVVLIRLENGQVKRIKGDN